MSRRKYHYTDGFWEFAIPNAIGDAIGIVREYGTGASIAEISDVAADQLCEWSCYLTPEEDSAMYADITRDVIARFGGTSDATHIPQDRLEKGAGR